MKSSRVLRNVRVKKSTDASRWGKECHTWFSSARPYESGSPFSSSLLMFLRRELPTYQSSRRCFHDIVVGESADAHELLGTAVK